MRAQRGANGVGADARRRAVVADEKTAPADHRLAPAHPRDRRRAGAGDDQCAVGAAMGAQARRHRVIGGAHER